MSKAKPKPAHADSKSQSPDTNELLLEPEVMARCRMSRSQIWKLERAGQFPKRKRYGFRRVAWVAGEIDLWIKIGIDAWVADQAISVAA
jgi:prophage regulatory protein